MRRSLLTFALFASVAGLGIDALFDEPGARPVSSLVTDARCRSVLAVFAHPDDEILVAGALTDAVKRGCAVYTVTATRGTRGVPANFTGDRVGLGRIREAELRRFGAVVGVQGQEVWDFPDGELSSTSAALLDSVSNAIRRYRPDLVVTFDPAAGFTGHPDHRGVGEVTLRASRQVYASMGRSTREAPKPERVARVVFPRRAARLVPDKELRGLLGEQPRADLAVKGNRRMTLLGMQIHRTQQQYFPPRWIRPLLYWFYDREYFVLDRLEPDGSG